MQHSRVRLAAYFVAFAGSAACGSQGEEPERVPLPVVTTDVGIAPFTNAEGWRVELSGLWVVVDNLEFTIEGETHAAWWPPIYEWLVPSARAHPGHYAGGEVTGELTGHFIINLLADSAQDLGTALLLPGDYNGLNFTFGRANDADTSASQTLIGHTALFEGTASKAASQVSFSAIVDVDLASQMVGGPFELQVVPGLTKVLALTAYTVDPSEGDTLFDGIDFSSLDTEDGGVFRIQPGEPFHNILMKTLVRHDHWGIIVEDPR